MTATKCAWSNRLQTQHWRASPDIGQGGCLSPPARWWAWAQARMVPAGKRTAWNEVWSKQGLIGEAGTQKRAAIIERAANGSWVATEWTWDPSPRVLTRQWQESRWAPLEARATRMRQSRLAEPALHEAAPFKAAWEKNLNGSAGEISSAAWLWERDGLCLRMEAMGLSQAQLHLPYRTEDGRLEQRAAMQLRLARTYPEANWLAPFHLLPQPNSRTRSGAKYAAIWVERMTVKGQIWIPAKTDGTVARARIVVQRPAMRDTAADAAVSRIARQIDLELNGLATNWARDNEQ